MLKNKIKKKIIKLKNDKKLPELIHVTYQTRNSGSLDLNNSIKKF
jgi:hypothetical protein